MPRRKHRRSKGMFGSKGTGSIVPVIVSGAVYGAVRPTAATWISPITNMLPFGSFNDEITLGVLGYFIAKKMKNPYVRDFGKAMLYVEAASIGSQVSGGMTQTSSASMQTIG